MITRKLVPMSAAAHGKSLMGSEPLVFHCNYYNYFLQKTLLLDETLGMEWVLRAAAAEVARGVLQPVAGRPADEVLQVAKDLFAECGFGTIDFSGLSADGGEVVVPVSHYGTCLSAAAGSAFAQPQSWFDAGFSVGASEVAFGREPGGLDGEILACQSMGAPEGRIRVIPGQLDVYQSPGQGHHEASANIPEPLAHRTGSAIDETAIHAALATIDFAGNEEGLIPRFGVMLTNHLANFYNRISFEYMRRMEQSGMIEAAEMLLTEAGHRCAYHTFGGIMTSPEWDAVVRPSCNTWSDWAHGIVAVINALGWGVWRLVELDENRLVMAVYDDYEACGYRGMYGEAMRPVSYLAAGGAAGIMNLIRVGDIRSRPALDCDAYRTMFESDDCFESCHTKSLTCGDDYSEVVVERA